MQVKVKEGPLSRPHTLFRERFKLLNCQRFLPQG
jgi:hypothetical protein